MKASVTRYPGEDGEQDQIVIRMCPENAAILHEILGSADTELFTDGDGEGVDPECIVSGTFFESLHSALKSDERGKFYLFDNDHGTDNIDYCVCRKGD